jgi:predicted RNase H-like nuclease
MSDYDLCVATNPRKLRGARTAAQGRAVAGVDGCPAGWLAVVVHGDGSAESLVARRFAELLARTSAVRILVDMPIGLPERAARRVEREARALLGRPRASSIFAVPSRAAVYAGSYAETCAANSAGLGVRVSRQAWNICRKIRELDELLAAEPALAERVLESHPEICFHALAGHPMRHSKRSAAGRAERLAVLARAWPQAETVYARAAAAHARRDVALDDIVDAIALAVCARSATLERIPAEPERDARGLPMQMCYARGNLTENSTPRPSSMS